MLKDTKSDGKQEMIRKSGGVGLPVNVKIICNCGVIDTLGQNELWLF